MTDRSPALHLSKFLSLVLRHRPEAAGASLDANRMGRRWRPPRRVRGGRRQDRPHRIVVEDALRRAGVEWTVGVEANGWELMVHFVALGLGVAIVNAGRATTAGAQRSRAVAA